MSEASIRWKEKIVTKKLFDDEMEINVAHRALYDENGTELIWDRIVMEAILRIFFRLKTSKKIIPLISILSMGRVRKYFSIMCVA